MSRHAAPSELGTDLQSIGNQARDRASSPLDTSQAAEKTSEAYTCYGVGAFFVVAGVGAAGMVLAYK